MSRLTSIALAIATLTLVGFGFWVLRSVSPGPGSTQVSQMEEHHSGRNPQETTYVQPPRSGLSNANARSDDKEIKNEDPRFVRQKNPFGDDKTPVVGLSTKEVSEAVLREHKVDARYKTGVMVETVHPRSPAAEAALRSGDIIVVADKKLLTSERELRERAEGKEFIVVVISRAGRMMNAVLRALPED